MIQYIKIISFQKTEDCEMQFCKRLVRKKIKKQTATLI